MRTQKLLKLRKARREEALRRFNNKWTPAGLRNLENADFYVLYRLRSGGQDVQFISCGI